MANLNETQTWESGIYQIETIDRVVGGPDGTANLQAKQLANRTAFLAGPNGASKVGHTPAGTGAVTMNVQETLQDLEVSVKNFGADPTGAASSLAAFQNAVNSHRNVYVPPGTYKLDGRLLISTAGTCLRLGPNVTINCSGWLYPGSQTPFGNQIHITGHNCAVIGSGPSSLIQITNGSQANGIGFLHCSRGLVANLRIDGGKAGVAGFIDDTFGSGIEVINYDDQNLSGLGGKFTFQNLIISNWIHYGVNLFGNICQDVSVTDCVIHDNGKVGDAGSVGGGIVMTKAINRISIIGCKVFNNKNSGILASSAGASGGKITISGNYVENNGLHGVILYESPDYGSTTGQGLEDIAITGNNISSNQKSGILIGTYYDVGFLRNITVTGNTVTDNGEYGALIQTNNGDNWITSNVVLSGNVFSYNGQYGIGLGLYLKSVIATDNICLLNTAGAISDNSSGTTYGTSVANNLTSVTVPFYATGTFTPTVEGATTVGTGTYTARSGKYTKQGNRVFFDILLAWTAHTGTGDIKVTGLPFAVASEEPQVPIWVQANDLTITGQASLLVLGGGTSGLLVQSNNGSVGTVAIDAAAQLRISGSYRTDI